MDENLAGAYGFASLSLQVALLNLFVLKGILTTTEVAEVTTLAADSVEQAASKSSSPEMTMMARQCLEGIAQSFAARAKG
ncbi:MAG TPA: hypothetical protein VGB82_10600 [Alphaproteobacteria bacterium]